MRSPPFAAGDRLRQHLTALAAIGCPLALLACGAPRGTTRPAATPPANAAAFYEAEPAPEPVRGDGDRAALAAAIARAGQNAALPLHGDGRLALLAERFSSGTPDAARLSAAARELGLVDGELALRSVSADAAELLPAALVSELAGSLPALAPTHFGAFIERGAQRAIVALGRRPPALGPFPRRMPRGAVLRVRGRLAATERDPTLAVVGPGRSLSVPAGAGPAFELTLPTWGDGVYQVRLRALAGAHTRTAAEWAVYVGDVEDAPPAPLASAQPIKAELYDRLRALRADSGLAPLAIDAQLEQRAMRPAAAEANAAEDSERTTPSASFARADARAPDASALFMALVSQPGFRAALLGAEVTHIGAGVSGSREGGFSAAVLVTRLAPALLDPELAPARILTAINENRRARGAAALRPDAELARVARRAAAELAAHPELPERSVVERANAELGRFALAYRRVAAVAASVRDPLEAAALEPALEPDARAAGIALAPSANRDRAAVVIALGWER